MTELCLSLARRPEHGSVPFLFGCLATPASYCHSGGRTLECKCESIWVIQDEVEEVEAKLEASEQQPRTKWQRVLMRLCTPVFLEALILTFLAG